MTICLALLPLIFIFSCWASVWAGSSSDGFFSSSSLGGGTPCGIIGGGRGICDGIATGAGILATPTKIYVKFVKCVKREESMLATLINTIFCCRFCDLGTAINSNKDR